MKKEIAQKWNHVMEQEMINQRMMKELTGMRTTKWETCSMSL